MESSIDLLFEYDIRLQVMHSWSNIASENSQEKTRRSYIPDYLSVVIKENLVDPSDRELGWDCCAVNAAKKPWKSGCAVILTNR